MLLMSFASSPTFGDVPKLHDFGHAPEFEGLTHDGKVFKSAYVLSNKLSIINFFFSTCQGPCPVLMSKIEKIIRDTSCKNVHFVSISVDPEQDTPEVLNNYRKERSFDAINWDIINVPEEKVIDLLNEGYKLGSGGDIINHSTRIVIVDPNNKIRSLISGMDDNTTDKVLSTIDSLCE